MEYRYEGSYNEHSQRHGEGHAWFANGDEYEGRYENGRREGHGIYRFANGAVYDGQWVNGKKNGKGKFTYPDGSLYHGNWLDDQRSGFGHYHYMNGDVYEGEWLDHLRHGPGRYTYAANGIVYTGTWEKGQRVGPGTVNVLSHDTLVRSLALMEERMERYGKEEEGQSVVLPEGPPTYPGGEGVVELAGRKAWWRGQGGDETSTYETDFQDLKGDRYDDDGSHTAAGEYSAFGEKEQYETSLTGGDRDGFLPEGGRDRLARQPFCDDDAGSEEGTVNSKVEEGHGKQEAETEQDDKTDNVAEHEAVTEWSGDSERQQTNAADAEQNETSAAATDAANANQNEAADQDTGIVAEDQNEAADQDTGKIAEDQNEAADQDTGIAAEDQNEAAGQNTSVATADENEAAGQDTGIVVEEQNESAGQDREQLESAEQDERVSDDVEETVVRDEQQDGFLPEGGRDRLANMDVGGEFESEKTVVEQSQSPADDTVSGQGDVIQHEEEITETSDKLISGSPERIVVVVREDTKTSATLVGNLQPATATTAPSIDVSE